MTLETRRSFTQKSLSSLLTFGLVQTLAAQHLLADAIKPVIQRWLVELHDLSKDVKDQKIKDVDFQTKLEELYQRVDLADLIRFLDLDRLSNTIKYPQHGAASVAVDLSKVEGLPTPLVFGRQIFACQKGRSIVPHGHDNFCTGFVVLRGEFHGRHYDRVEDHAAHYLIRPTVDRAFKPGDCSTISDHKDNVHWFKAESDVAFVFNIHVGRYNPESQKAPSRVYLDPAGEKTNGGLIVAKKISSAECHKKYG